MRSGREVDFRVRSPVRKVKDRRSDEGRRVDGYRRRSDYSREERDPRALRNLGPSELETSRGVMARNHRRSSSLEGGDRSRRYDDRRDYPIDGQNRMPSFGQSQDRSTFIEEVLPRRGSPSADYRSKYRMMESSGLNGNLSPTLKYAGSYESREKDVQVGSSSIRDEHDVLLKKDLHFDDRASRALFAPMPDSVGGTYMASSVSYNIGLRVDEEFRYGDGGRLDPLLARKYYSEEDKMAVRKYYGEEDKMPVGKGYGEEEKMPEGKYYGEEDKMPGGKYYSQEDKPVLYSNDAYYPRMPVSQASIFETSSSGLMKSDVPLAYRGNMPLPSDEFDDRNGRFPNSFRVDEYGRTGAFDISREPKDLLPSDRGIFGSSSRGEQWDNNHHEVGRLEKRRHAYSSDEFYRTSLLDARGEYGDRDLSGPRPSYIGVDVDRINDMNRSHKEVRKDGLLDQHLLQRESAPSYTDMKRTSSYGVEKDVDFLGTGRRYLEFGASMSGNAETTHAEGSYAYERESGLGSHKDIMNGSSIFESNLNAYRLDVSPEQRQKAEELGIQPPSAREIKRKYVMEEDLNDYKRKYDMEEDVNDYRRKYAMEENLNDYKRKYVAEDLNDYKRNYVVEEDLNDYERRYAMEEELNDYSSKRAILNSRDIARRAQEQDGSDEQRTSRIRGLLSSKRSLFSRLKFPKSGWPIKKMGSNRLKVQRADMEPHVFGGRKRSIKERLNFASRHVHSVKLGRR